jgi:hypothetical protein
MKKWFGGTNQKVAIVGSSKNLKDHGPKIDQFDHVIRFNLAFPTDTKKLGRKTTAVACNVHVSNALLRKSVTSYIRRKIITKEYASNLLKYHAQQNPIYICRANSVANPYKHNVIKIPHHKSKNFCNTILKKIGVKTLLRKEPRLGFHLVCAMIDLKIYPTLFYFDIEKPNSAKYYSNLNNPVCHDVCNEGIILKSLENMKLVKVVR